MTLCASIFTASYTFAFAFRFHFLPLTSWNSFSSGASGVANKSRRSTLYAFSPVSAADVDLVVVNVGAVKVWLVVASAFALYVALTSYISLRTCSMRGDANVGLVGVSAVLAGGD